MEQNKILIETLINIDSTDRNINPKNICITDNITLPINPIVLIDQNILKINYPNHNLSRNDNIVINNVVGYTKIISNQFYLINNFKYILIDLLDNNNINIDYINSLYINIDIYNEINEKEFINNIPFNSIIGIQESINAYKILNLELEYIKNIIIKIFNYNDRYWDWNKIKDYLNTNCLFINLPIEYIDNTNDYYIINQIFKIEYLHINGIKLGFINSDYPINYENYQGYQEVYEVINNNTFLIKLNVNGYINNISAGGNNVKIKKIINSIIGYPNINNYAINLKKSFNNVIDIKLVSSEFPYADLLIKKNINDKIYWKNIDDGQHIYHIQVDEGFYTSIQLLNKMKLLMNNVPRISSTNINNIYNNFDIILEQNTNKITFNSYKLSKLPNCLSIIKYNYDSQTYYILNVYHPQNLINVNDTIIINNSTDVTFKNITNDYAQIFSISQLYINRKLTVYSINKENNSYDIILGNIDEITINLVNYETKGGENITITTPSKTSFLFNYNDTLGNILGFKNVGYKYSITDFLFSISNDIIYNKYDMNLDSIGNNINYDNEYLNFVGSYNYFLMYLNNIEYIYSTSTVPPAFSKILLTGNPGDILFNTFVEQPKNQYDKIFPIANLTEFNIYFLYPDGKKVDFRNLNHSFTLKITEEKQINKNSNLNSRFIKILDYYNT
jgi:hypothetical protein